MLYESTRGGAAGITSAEAIKTGIAPDGGLFVPERLAKVSQEKLIQMADMSYMERAGLILGAYLDDYKPEEINACIKKAYGSKFNHDKIVPFIKLSDQMFIQELWHGPTSAFKDMALQILPHLLVRAVKKTGEEKEIIVLVATSGDTGKAALEGFKDVKGTKIIVFFPDEGVSEIQKMQMITQEGENVYAIGIKGNFDDAQSGVKNIFTNFDIKEKMAQRGFMFSSANSINWGRLAPQIVYYFSTYADLFARKEVEMGELINIVVPTGNFGNILAAYYAYRMGLPVNRLICASNENNVLTEFIISGTYDRRRDFVKTISPSMDILISSNLERLLYEANGRNFSRVREWMQELAKEGFYKIDDETHDKIASIFWSEYSNENEILNTIRSIYEEYNYIVDTHTAVGIDVYDKYVISTGDVTKSVIASTASPFKFNKSVCTAILGKESVVGKSEFELLDMLAEKSGLVVPEGLKGLDTKEIRHNIRCGVNEMRRCVEKILRI